MQFISFGGGGGKKKSHADHVEVSETHKTHGSNMIYLDLKG